MLALAINGVPKGRGFRLPSRTARTLILSTIPSVAAYKRSHFVWSVPTKQNVVTVPPQVGGRLTGGMVEAPPFPSASINATREASEPTTLSLRCAVIGSHRMAPPETIV